MSHFFTTSQGHASLLGTSYTDDGVNFAIYSSHATAINLCLFAPGASTPIEIPLDSKKNKTGDVWHIFVHQLPPHYRYGYRVDGPYQPILGHAFDNRVIILDPYATWLDAPQSWHPLRPPQHYLAFVGPAPDFDWEGDLPLQLPMKDLVIYEMHVRGFTQDPSSKVAHPGTFLGVIEKIPYLKNLGINAVELLPIHEFKEWENPFVNPMTGQRLCNYWGYSTVNFFAPMRRYGQLEDFKQMVKALHRVGIEVILDVVYNHTAEGDAKGPTLSFKGFDNSIYYMLVPHHAAYYNFTGCGNTVNCNHPIVIDLIVSSLRYWVEHMHVDGFRFDLASILTRDRVGAPLPSPPVLEAIASDPILSKTKLIAEAWDAGGLYQIGSFPHYHRFSEWNGKFRDHVRRFIKGTDGEAGHFSTRLCGSEDLYHGRAPYHSINFVTSHDGFSMHDLVSYNDKHNLSNGEGNRDGDNNNESWNCGEEGKSTDSKVLTIRKRQMKNFMLSLFLSSGVPMLHMGDEYGHTKRGNNNTWGHDNRLNWFLWDVLEQQEEMFTFTKRMIEIRRLYPILRRTQFLNKHEIVFHGVQPKKPDWSPHSRFVAFTLFDHIGGYRLYAAINAHFSATTTHIPKLPSGRWELLIDTARTIQPTRGEALPAFDRRIPPHSAILLVANTPHIRS